MNIDDCVPEACAINATCLDEVNSFMCLCQARITRSQCEVNITGCILNTCLNSGTCSILMELMITFASVSGYNSINCSENINNCGLNLCNESAACIDGITGFIC